MSNENVYQEKHRPQFHFAPSKNWMNNWDYAEKVPPENWRGAMTVPRKVELVQTNQRVRLTQ